MTLLSLWQEGRDRLLAAGVPDAGDDARYLLLAAFEINLSRYLLEQSRVLPQTPQMLGRAERYRGLLKERAQRIPLQQLLGVQEFMGLPFSVNENVLIPRQDTETLAELVLTEMAAGNPGLRLLDLCTGSGCLALSLAVKGHFRSVIGTDISAAALSVAEGNKTRLAVPEGTEVTFYRGDLFAALPAGTAPFDVIVSNPPYVVSGEIETLAPEVRLFEPLLALDGGRDGLDFYRRIAAEAGTFLAPGGRIYLEIGCEQGTAVLRLLSQAGFQNIRIVRDLTGRNRVVTGEGHV